MLGQITSKEHLGVLTMENNLFKVPIFKQKLPKTDFLLVRYRDDEGKDKFYVRKIEFIYIVGQIEPKLEVFSPNSRLLNAFIKKCLKFVIKQSFKLEGKVNFKDISKIFPSLNDHNLRKIIRELGGEQDIGDSKVFNYKRELIDSDNEQALCLDSHDMTPEDVCLYNQMHAGLSKLKCFGLRELRASEKMGLAKNKLFKKFQNNERIRAICKVIIEELNLTCWNLSQSFITTKQMQGRLFLTGYGDPTNNHGGLSYIKLPLKISRLLFLTINLFI